MLNGVKGGSIGALALLLCATFAAPSSAETGQVTIARQNGIGYLPLAVMEVQGIVEKKLAEEGLTETTVAWSRFGSGSAANDALLSGQLNFASGGTSPGLILWDRTRTNAKVHGVAALSAMPNLLVSTDPDVQSITDFDSNDRIAMAGAGSSVQTVYLQMAVAKEWGMEHYQRLNDLMVNLPHPEGLSAMLSDGGVVRSTFTTPPFQQMALKEPNVHVVLNSYDVMEGPNTFLMIWGTDQFRTENPKTYRAVLEALRESMDWINDNPREAAELYMADAGQSGSVEEIEAIILDEQTRFSLTPERILPYAQFMNEVGTLRNRPESWEELFFPEIHDLDGS